MIERELVAASSASFILSILGEADSYGYEIIQRVASITCGELSWSEAMLYPVLHRLEVRKYVKSYWQESENGRRRKYYAITNSGRAALAEKKRQWDLISAALDQLAVKANERN